MLKFDRNYKINFEIGYRKNLTEYVPQEIVEVAYPFTLQLDINRNAFSSLNTGVFNLYNLSNTVKAKLWKDKYDNSKYITMRVYAGYGDFMPLIFTGDILQCYSYRDSGSTEYITTIQANDAGYLFQYGFANRTFEKGTTFPNLLNILLEPMPNIKIGYITPDIQDLARAQTFIGQTMDLLGREYGKYQIFVDNSYFNILGERDVIANEAIVISDDSGLLGTPKRAETFLEVQMIFEPQLVVGQIAYLASSSMPGFNGTYKVIGIKHNGIISPTENGNLYTNVTLSLGTELFRELKKWQNSAYGGTPTSGTWAKPVQGKVSSSFGQRSRPTAGASTYHKGMDIAAPMGTPITAPANGRVITAGTQGGYGKLVEIDNGIINNVKVSSRYGHMQNYIVAPNQVVNQGQIIGYVGSTGISTGPHLHFEVRENGTPVNPTKYIGNY